MTETSLDKFITAIDRDQVTLNEARVRLAQAEIELEQLREENAILVALGRTQRIHIEQLEVENNDMATCLTRVQPVLDIAIAAQKLAVNRS